MYIAAHQYEIILCGIHIILDFDLIVADSFYLHILSVRESYTANTRTRTVYSLISKIIFRYFVQRVHYLGLWVLHLYPLFFKSYIHEHLCECDISDTSAA